MAEDDEGSWAAVGEKLDEALGDEQGEGYEAAAESVKAVLFSFYTALGKIDVLWVLIMKMEQLLFVYRNRETHDSSDSSAANAIWTPPI